jgi:hypothetical protein
MRKKILTLLLLVCQTLAFANGSALLITLKDGRKAGYILSEKPSVTLGDSRMIIKVKDASTEYNVADVSTFTFIDASEYTGIEQLSQGSTKFEYRNGTIKAEGATIQVFTLDGKQLKNGVSTVSLSGQPNGVYVVKMNNQVIKIKK